MVNKVYSYIGLAMKAGFVQSGEFQCEKSIQEKKAYLVIVSNDASDNTKKNFSDSCAFYKVPIAFYGTKDELGHAIGKEFRASIAVCDENFAKVILKQIETVQ